jgi:hypothetical protein
MYIPRGYRSHYCDCKSSNGTFINGTRLLKGEIRELRVSAGPKFCDWHMYVNELACMLYIQINDEISVVIDHLGVDKRNGSFFPCI